MNDERLYIYVKDWDDYRPRNDRPNLPWLRLHTSLLGNDAWLELSCPDRCLLICIWMLTQRYGNGRLKADERWLKGQAKAHKSSLERLVQAGWVTISTTKAAPIDHQNGGLEERRGSYEPKKRERATDAAENGAAALTQEQKETRLAEMARIADAAGFHP